MIEPEHPRSSFVHGRADLRADNPLYARAGSSRSAFQSASDPMHGQQLADRGKTEAQRREDGERAARREAFMVKRQKPAPMLKPGPALAHGADRASFNRQWSEEMRAARPRGRDRSR